MSDDGDGGLVETSADGFGNRLGTVAKDCVWHPFPILGAIALLVWNEGNAGCNAKGIGPRTKTSPCPCHNFLRNVGRGFGPFERQFDDAKCHSGCRNWASKRTIRPCCGSIVPWKCINGWNKRNPNLAKYNTATTYEQAWRQDVVHAASFKKETNHVNPNFMPYESVMYVADPKPIGAFSVLSDIVNKLS